MSTDDAPPASNERDTPTCKKCQSSEQVRDVAMYRRQSRRAVLDM